MRPLLIALALLAPVIACSQQSNKSTSPKGKSSVQSYTVTNPFVAYTVDPSVSSVYGSNVVWSQDAAANYNDLVTYVSSGAPANDKRVSLTLSGVSAKEALKKLFDEAGESYDVKDADLKDTTISLTVKDVRFNTALDLITQAAGVRYSVEIKDNKRLYHIGKTVKSGLVYADPSGAGKVFITSPNAKWDGDLALTYGKLLRTPPNNLNSELFAPRFYSAFTSEERSSFTCPSCKGQVTVIRHRQQPKCPKCGKAFAGDWQYCPNDGTKRPATTGTWKYCPICGKEVKMEPSEKLKLTAPAAPAPGAGDAPKEP